MRGCRPMPLSVIVSPALPRSSSHSHHSLSFIISSSPPPSFLPPHRPHRSPRRPTPRRARRRRRLLDIVICGSFPGFSVNVSSVCLPPCPLFVVPSRHLSSVPVRTRPAFRHQHHRSMPSTAARQRQRQDHAVARLGQTPFVVACLPTSNGGECSMVSSQRNQNLTTTRMQRHRQRPWKCLLWMGTRWRTPCPPRRSPPNDFSLRRELSTRSTRMENSRSVFAPIYSCALLI